MYNCFAYILYYINQYRASIGLPALQLINEASSEATKHSAEMANRTTAFGHDGFDERIDNVVKKIGIVHASAENVAYGKLKNISPQIGINNSISCYYFAAS